jgi:hypothetical protein
VDNLRRLALLFLLPGLAGLIISSVISVSYLDSCPKMPDPPAMRMTPRTIHGVTIYQTEDENRRLDVIEYSSTMIFLIGLGLSLVYLRKWGIARAIDGEEGALELD